MSITEKLKHAVFEDEETKPKSNTADGRVPSLPPTSRTPVQTVTVPAFAPAPTPICDTMPAPDNSNSSDVYPHLRDHTDFDKTPTGAIIQKFLAPLATLALDEHTKLKAAILQAKQEGITPETVLGVFDNLKTYLDQEKAAFETAANHFSQTVEQLQQAIQTKNTLIAQTQKEIVDLTTKYAAGQGKLQNMHSDFNGAYARRSTELDQQKTNFESLLKG